MKSTEVKVAEKLADGLNDVRFSPAVLANYLVTHYPIYTTERLMELVKYIIHYGSIEMRKEWEINGRTSEGLLIADTLQDLLDTITSK
jgi:hypothetical protein